MAEGPQLKGWLERISAVHPADMDLGLERVAAVADRLGVKVPAPTFRPARISKASSAAVVEMNTMLALSELSRCGSAASTIRTAPSMSHSR